MTIRMPHQSITRFIGRASVLASLLLSPLWTESALASWDESWFALASAPAPKAVSPVVTPSPAAAPGAPAVAELDIYNHGTDALDDGRWEEAINAFRQVEELRGSRADRAIYWTAYAQSRLGKLSSALETLTRLKREYPRSKWLKDAEALELELKAASGQKMIPEAEDDEDLKLMILNSLMQSDADRALPLIEKLLRSNNTPKVKEQALFILSQSSSPRAGEILASYARGEADPKLQSRAVEYIGLYGQEEHAGLLEEVYISSPHLDVRRKILETYMMSGNGDRLLAIARKEANPDLRRTAIEQLGFMGRTDALEELYQSESNFDLRRRIIESFMLAGESDRLFEMAKTEPEADLRREAIEQLGMMGETDHLWVLYTTETDLDLRRKILESFMFAGDDVHLMQLARADNNADLRRVAVEQLAFMGDSDVLVELYSTETDRQIKKQIIDGLMIAGDDNGLIDIARSEKDRELRKRAVEKLSLMNTDTAIEFMLELLDE